jgi:hypothetical protein
MKQTERKNTEEEEEEEEEKEKGPLLGQGLPGKHESLLTVLSATPSECQVKNLPRPSTLDQVRTGFLKTGPININGLKIGQSLLKCGFFLFCV